MSGRDHARREPGANARNTEVERTPAPGNRINGRPLYFRDIRDPNVRARFSVDQLHRWAAEYRDQIGAADTADASRAPQQAGTP